MTSARMTSTECGSLVFIDDVTEDRSSQMNSEVCRDRLSAQIQPIHHKLIERSFTLQEDSDPKRNAVEPKKWSNAIVKSANLIQLHFPFYGTKNENLERLLNQKKKAAA